MPPEEFASRRAEAEARARKGVPHGEVTLDDIYRTLEASCGWARGLAEQVQALELQVEKENLRVVPCAKALLDRARSSADKIYFISDMYLPVRFLEGILKEGGLLQAGDKFIISHEAQACKASGALYGQIRGELGKIRQWVHHGDNDHSDIKMARAHGIETVHFTRCSLTRYEEGIRPLTGKSPPLWRSKMAGTMRYSRVCNPAEGRTGAIWESGAQVVGPLLFAFVHWCLEKVSELKLDRLYFLSRDGFILNEIAKVLIHRWGYPVEARYLYGSRMAWQPAAITDLGRTDKNWIILRTQAMSVASTMARIGLRSDSVRNELQSLGYPPGSWDRVLSIPERERLWEQILASPIRGIAEAENARSRDLATRYLRQEGLFDHERWAIVDVGWHGNLQKSLHQILGRDDLQGLYFGLLRHTVRLNERFHDYWCTFEPPTGLERRNLLMFELFTSARHGSVTGYREKDGRVEPTLHEAVHKEAVEWGLDLLHGSILHFTETFAQSVERGAFTPADLFPLVRELYDRFYFSPSREEALAWGRFPHKPHANEIMDTYMVPEMSELEIIRALADYQRRPSSWWMEGANAVAFSPTLKAALALKRLKQKPGERKR